MLAKNEFDKPCGEIFKHADNETILCMRLSDDVPYSMVFSGWLFSRVFDAKLDASIKHYFDIGEGVFIPFEQFSLVREGAKPYFQATGLQASVALETLKQAFDSFNPADFDSDGYSINRTS